MRSLFARNRGSSSPGRRRAVRPTLEGLEDRMLLYSVTGDHFAFGGRITWSIMPDGTSLGGIPSNLNTTMALKGVANWTTALQDAFAQWESVAGVNFVQVGDDGAPFGSGNYQQGSSEFGDIRIGGMAQASNTLAFTMLPPSANGSSNSGDILLNTAQAWHTGTDYDLETVAVHEIGHALGLGHSTDINAAMYPYYGGVEQFANTDDINGVRSIWGARQEDPIEQLNGNLVSSKAPDLTSFITPSNGQAYMPGLDVASPSESYWFKITTPANCSNVFTAQVQSAGLSELSPRVVIFNSSLQGLTQGVAPSNAYGTTINATITNATPNTVYYVKVLGSNSGASGSGAYALTINTGFGYIGNAAPTVTTVLACADAGGGTELMLVGGFGNWLKSWLQSGEQTDLSSIGITDNPGLAAQVAAINSEMAAATAPTQQQLAADLTGLLQEVPDNVMDGTWNSPVASSGKGASKPLSLDQVEKILSKFFKDLDKEI